MPEQTGRTARGTLRVLVAVMVSAGLAGVVQAEDKAQMPPALADYVARMQSEVDFLDCVDASAKRQKLTDAVLIGRIAAAGLAGEAYAAVSGEVDGDPDALLRHDGFVPAYTDADKALAEKAMVLARMSVEGEAEAGSPSTSSMRAALRFAMASNDAIGAGCEPPPHMLPGGDPLREKVMAALPLMEESERMRACTTAAIATRGLDDEAAYALLEKQGLAGEFRTRALAIADAMPGLGADKRAKLVESDTSFVVGTRLSLLSSMTFDIESMARATGLNAIYLDRALDAKCDPSNALRTFIGVSDSANR